MNQLDARTQAGLAQLRERLAYAGRNSQEIEAIAAALASLSFPGLLAFLAGSRDDGPPHVERARELPEIFSSRDGGVGPEREALVRAAIATLAEDLAIPVSGDEARQIADLLASGEFYGDIAAASAEMLRVVPTLPITLTKDARTVHRFFQLPRALARDLDQGFFEALGTAGDLLDGSLDRDPHLLRHTMRVLYDIASVETTFEMIRSLIDPDNETIRLAIVLYARANGIELEPGDLDLLRQTVLNPQDPDLGPALVAASRRLEQRAGPVQALEILRRLARRPPTR